MAHWNGFVTARTSPSGASKKEPAHNIQRKQQAGKHPQPHHSGHTLGGSWGDKVSGGITGVRGRKELLRLKENRAQRDLSAQLPIPLVGGVGIEKVEGIAGGPYRLVRTKKSKRCSAISITRRNLSHVNLFECWRIEKA